MEAGPDPRRISVQLKQMFGGGGGDGLDTEALSGGILKTIEVEVVEEDITEADRRSLGKDSNPDEDWQKILRGGVRRANSRASARDRDSPGY